MELHLRPPPPFSPVQGNVSIDVEHHSALFGSDYDAISNIWPLLFLMTAKAQIGNSINSSESKSWIKFLRSRCHKTSLFSFTSLVRSSLTPSQSQLNGARVNLFLSSSLAHASQTAAARISKENSRLFKHSMQIRTHAAGFRGKRIRCRLMYTHNTHIQTLGAYLWTPFDKLRNFCWVVKSDIGQIGRKKNAFVCTYILSSFLWEWNIPSTLRRSWEIAAK